MISSLDILRARILVVDDEPSIVDAVATSLRYEGFEVAEAVTGRAALSAAQENPPDLIVLDVMLPDGDGLALCAAMRQVPATAQMPVIMLTAQGDPNARTDELLTMMSHTGVDSVRIGSLYIDSSDGGGGIYVKTGSVGANPPSGQWTLLSVP